MEEMSLKESESGLLESCSSSETHDKEKNRTSLVNDCPCKVSHHKGKHKMQEE